MFEKLFRKKSPDEKWSFSSPENEMTITVKQIVEKTLPILLVQHDNDDDEGNGGWQFLTGGDFNMEDGMLVGLKTITELDPTIVELANLEKGWQARRQALGCKWIKTKA